MSVKGVPTTGVPFAAVRQAFEREDIVRVLVLPHGHDRGDGSAPRARGSETGFQLGAGAGLVDFETAEFPFEFDGRQPRQFVPRRATAVAHAEQDRFATSTSAATGPGPGHQTAEPTLGRVFGPWGWSGGPGAHCANGTGTLKLGTIAVGWDPAFDLAISEV